MKRREDTTSKRPALKIGDLCRLSKSYVKRFNKRHGGMFKSRPPWRPMHPPRHVTLVVTRVGEKFEKEDGWLRYTARRLLKHDAGNGLCPVKVSYKYKGKWHSRTMERRDLYLAKRA